MSNLANNFSIIAIFLGSYAFLEFDEEDDARKAIDEMNHQDFKGQTLNVELGGQIKRAKVILRSSYVIFVCENRG